MAPAAPEPLQRRLEDLGRRLGAREAEVAGALDAARGLARELHAKVAEGLGAFHAAAAAAGAPHLQVALEEPRLDDKHVRAVQFALSRGRTRAIVTVKSRGDVTLVGPFHSGKAEGPCQSFPSEARSDIEAALAEFLERFLEDAATP